MTSSTINKKLEIYTKLKLELEMNKNLENFESNFKFFVHFEFYFEFFVISIFLSMVDELTVSKREKQKQTTNIGIIWTTSYGQCIKSNRAAHTIMVYKHFHCHVTTFIFSHFSPDW